MLRAMLYIWLVPLLLVLCLLVVRLLMLWKLLRLLMLLLLLLLWSLWSLWMNPQFLSPGGYQAQTHRFGSALRQLAGTRYALSSAAQESKLKKHPVSQHRWSCPSPDCNARLELPQPCP